jgi:hypothetical protein
MPVIGHHEFRVSVILYPEGGFWIAQGVEFDITARGRTPVEASEKFHDKFGAELIMSLEVKDDEPLSGVGPAPQEFWTMHKNATMRVVVDDTPMRLSSGPASHVRPDIRIADKRLAA